MSLFGEMFRLPTNIYTAMKVIKKGDTIAFTNSKTCHGQSFDFGSKDLDIAVVTVNGRYPDKGHLVNEECREIAYVLSGSGLVEIADETHELAPGDGVMINPGERFYWQGNKLEMLMPCAPAFSPK